METLMLPNSSWLMQPGRRTRWTKEENKMFESALAMIDERTPDRWVRVAHMVPGKSVSDVINRFQELAADVSNIEAGLVPVPGYLASSFPVELVDDHRGFAGFRKRGRGCDQERKKGVPWTEEEHRRFLMGLDKYGKGDWRNISRNYVISKTPTQVASHAQKYFLRQLSGSKDKRRPSIHDITTFNLADPNPSEAKKSVSDVKSVRGTLVPKTIAGTPELESWNFPDDGVASMFHAPADSSFVAYPSLQVGYAKFGLEINPTRYQTLRG